MKKLLALFLCLTLMSVLPGFAEETAPPATTEGGEPYVFTLRNGIKWGMSFEDVKATEWPDIDVEGTVIDSALNTAEYDLDNVQVSNYSMDLGTFFVSDQLVCIAYWMWDSDETAFDYLRNALASKYGELTLDQNQRSAELLSILLTGTPDDAVNVNMHAVHLVTLSDGTVVTISMMDGNQYTYIMYFAEPLIHELFGIYNTFGL